MNSWRIGGVFVSAIDIFGGELWLFWDRDGGEAHGYFEFMRFEYGFWSGI